MKRSTALLAAGTLFALGVGVGVVGTHAFFLHQMHRPGGLAHLGMGLMSRRLEWSLHLDAEQKQKVEAILKQTGEELAEVRKKSGPEILAILDRSHERLKTVLNPEQRQQLDAYRSRYHHMAEGFILGK